MQGTNFDLEKYLSRIGYEGSVSSDFDSIKSVMQAQVRAIPFENIDVQLGRGVSLEANDIFSKIVVDGRGGYCYEQNGLFAQFLNALDLRYQVVACRPMFYPEYRPRTHLALIVFVDGKRWLCDLGFGALGITEPVDLDLLSTALELSGDHFKLEKGEEDYYILLAKNEGIWQSQYAFNLSKFDWIDFIPANYFNSTSPDSFFVQRLVVLIKTPIGRYSLVNQKLKSVENGKAVEKDLELAELPEVLLNIFKVPSNTIDELMESLRANA